MAAQILSHSVAAGISFLVKVKELPDAMSTAKFIEHINALFNTFNSKTLKSSQRHGNAFNDLSHHHAFLEQSLKFLDDIKTLEILNFHAHLDGNSVFMPFLACGSI